MNTSPVSELTLTEKVMRAMENAVAKVVEEHRRNGEPMAVWRNGKVVLEIPPPIDTLREGESNYTVDKGDTDNTEIKQ